MIIEKREHHKFSKKRQDEKIIDTLIWVAHWGQSTLSQIARKIGISEKTAYPFLNSLVQKKFLQICANAHTNSLRLYRVTNRGLAHLLQAGIDPQRTLSKAKVESNTRIIHDLTAQNIAIDFISEHACDRVDCARNISLKMRVRADFLAYTGKFSASVEYDRSAKNLDEFYARLTSAYDEIKAGLYSSAFVFSKSPDVIHRYVELFNANHWPIYIKNDKGRLQKLESSLVPDDEIKRLFHFEICRSDIDHFSSKRILKQEEEF